MQTMDPLLTAVTIFSLLTSLTCGFVCFFSGVKKGTRVFKALLWPLGSLSFVFTFVYGSVLLGYASSDTVGPNLLRFVVGVVWFVIGCLVYVVTWTNE